mmetsp:Transcript_20124/g.20224  ORF Transcript_20124/g.20224 Transcript_20124/m.20224 type:complete len:256 (+) Transcript_20124:23-790(+)
MNLELIIGLCGVIYCALWSFSLYPQVLMNYRRGSVQGMSLDFAVLNVLGFSAYALYTCLLSYDQSLRTSFWEKYHKFPPVELQDVAFAVHGLIIVVVNQWQVYVLERGAKQRVSYITWLICAGLCSILVCLGVLTLNHIVSPLVLVTGIGEVKVVCSTIKYVPQVVSNHMQRSTVGFAVDMALLDAAGSIFSIAQQAFRCIQQGSMLPITKNMSKTLLGLVSLTFDVILISQHFCLYPEITQDEEQHQLLHQQPI